MVPKTGVRRSGRWIRWHPKADLRLRRRSGARLSLGSIGGLVLCTNSGRLTFDFGGSVLKKIIVSIESPG